MNKHANISYKDSRGNVFDLMADDIRRISSANFHKYEWQKEVTEKRFGERLRGWKKSSPEYEVVVIFTGAEDERAERLNQFHEALEYDIKNASPGTLYWNDYYIECYGVSSVTEPAQDYAAATANQITFYCPDPWWKKITGRSFLENSNVEIDAYIRSGSEDRSYEWLSETTDGEPLVPDDRYKYIVRTTGDHYGEVYRWVATQYELLYSVFDKDYEELYDYEYDYGYDGFAKSSISNHNVLGSKWAIAIYGPVAGPYIKFENGDKSMVVSFPYLTVPAGAVLVVDSSKKTAVATLYNGSTVNCFGARDPDYYLWSDIPGGLNYVIWDGSFNFDVLLIDERSEPRWLTD